MMMYFEDLAIEVEGQSVESQTAAVPARMNLFLAEAESLIVSAISKDVNDHQLIHLQELSKNCLGAVIAITEAFLLSESDEEAHEQILQFHPELCGLLHDVDEFWGHSGHQPKRAPYSPKRVGLEVTYEEIANLFRTSRVNIHELVHTSCFRKLRVRLKDFHE
jgi:hypothetical protein